MYEKICPLYVVGPILLIYVAMYFIWLNKKEKKEGDNEEKQQLVNRYNRTSGESFDIL